MAVTNYQGGQDKAVPGRINIPINTAVLGHQFAFAAMYLIRLYAPAGC